MNYLNASVIVLHIRKELADYFVEVLCSGDTAEIGTWLMEIPKEAVLDAVDFIFKKYTSIRRVRYRRGYAELGMCESIDHVRIKLPFSSDELNMRLSAKTRYNMKRERRMLENAVGSLVFEEHEVHSIPNNVFEAYIRFKEKNERSHGRCFQDFGCTSCVEYMNRAHVSNVYVMRSKETEKVISMVLSCEQCTIPYMHNLAYDPDMSQYSPGKMIYNHYLCELIKKGKREIFLGGGYYPYKKHYGGIEEFAFRGVIYKYRIEYFVARCKIFLHNVLRVVHKTVKYLTTGLISGKDAP